MDIHLLCLFPSSLVHGPGTCGLAFSPTSHRNLGFQATETRLRLCFLPIYTNHLPSPHTSPPLHCAPPLTTHKSSTPGPSYRRRSVQVHHSHGPQHALQIRVRHHNQGALALARQLFRTAVQPTLPGSGHLGRGRLPAIQHVHRPTVQHVRGHTLQHNAHVWRCRFLAASSRPRLLGPAQIGVHGGGRGHVGLPLDQLLRSS